MRILIALTYFQPHKSGLTVYAVRLAKALSKRGHSVTVLTSRYSSDLAEFEHIDGVEVIRLPILMRVSKGVIMPGLPFVAWKLIRQSDVVNLHVPQLDAAFISIISRLLGKPVVVTYQCDLRLPSGFINWIANKVSFVADRISASLAHVIVAISQDYAENSIFLPHYLKKVQVVRVPISLPDISDQDVELFKQKYQITPEQRIIGIAARLATEKGVEYLVEAMPTILKRYPTARVLSCGQYLNVMGEETYAQKLMPLINKLGHHWTFLGILPDKEMTAFFRACDVTVLPSVNSTESFGMVQVESMVCGTPVVASDLPGVRQPVLATKMGLIVQPRDPEGIAKAVIALLDAGHPDRGQGKEIAEQYSPESTALAYETIFKRLLSNNARN
jgi:glycosyltransferase involved in cell wall biosynthesis